MDALGSALSRVAEWSNRAQPLTLIPDAAATLFAVRTSPGIPEAGIVAVCDFGGSGTSVTLVDAAAEYQPVAPTVRYHDFSGRLVDQALLTAVMDNMPGDGSFVRARSSAIGSLSRLRAGCRIAKEQLSSSTVTTLSDESQGLRGDIRLTRSELDDAIRAPLDNFIAVLEETLLRNGIRRLRSGRGGFGGRGSADPRRDHYLVDTTAGPCSHDAAAAADGRRRRRASSSTRSGGSPRNGGRG